VNRTKNILRASFFGIAAVLIGYMNIKSDEHAGSVAEFKFKMYKRLKTDSLDTRHKLDLVVNETRRFIDNSSQVRNGIDYLMGLLGVTIVFELAFLVLDKRASDTKEDSQVVKKPNNYS
jgi:hypothetical protein